MVKCRFLCIPFVCLGYNTKLSHAVSRPRLPMRLVSTLTRRDQTRATRMRRR